MDIDLHGGEGLLQTRLVQVKGVVEDKYVLTSHVKRSKSMSNSHGKLGLCKNCEIEL